jgi:hypothetical protein
MKFGQQALFPPSLWLVTCLILGASAADEDFDCHVKLGASQYDLTKLEGVHSVTHNWASPPSEALDLFEWNLCKDLEVHGDIKEEDQVSACNNHWVTLEHEFISISALRGRGFVSLDPTKKVTIPTGYTLSCR